MPRSNLLWRVSQPPRGCCHLPGVPSKRVWKGQVGAGDSNEPAGASASPDCPSARSQRHQRAERGTHTSARALFIVPHVREDEEGEENHGEEGSSVAVPTGPRVPQRGGSKRYSRSGCRSLCSLFLFLANSRSMAITSCSNSAGAGFASAGKPPNPAQSCPRTAVTPSPSSPAAPSSGAVAAGAPARQRAAAPVPVAQ